MTSKQISQHSKDQIKQIINYFFSKTVAWYWITIAMGIASTLAVFAIPDNAYPIIYLRTALGIVFVLFLPGFTLMKLLFPSKRSIKLGAENLHITEFLTVSVAMSLALIALVGLMLNYTPWGIRLAPITFSLLLLSIVFATITVLREYQEKQAVKSLPKSF